MAGLLQLVESFPSNKRTRELLRFKLITGTNTKLSIKGGFTCYNGTNTELIIKGGFTCYKGTKTNLKKREDSDVIKEQTINL